MTDKYKYTNVQITVGQSKMQMTFGPEDKELVETTLLWMDKKLNGLLKPPERTESR